MAANPYYDEELHDICKEYLRLALKLYFEFAARSPTPMPTHTVYTAGELLEAIDNDEFSMRDMAALYYFITNELDQAGNLLKFVKLPLLFASQETLETDEDDEG